MLLAVYGTLKKSRGNHYLLRNSILEGEFFTEPVYNMYTNGSFPTVTKGGNTSIFCEVYNVSDDVLADIYRLEGYTGVKNHTNNWYDTLDINTPYGVAQMFYMKEQPANTQIIKTGIF